MKHVLWVLLFAAGLTMPARAQVLRRIDPSQIADVSGKIVGMPVLTPGTVAEPTRPLPTSELSDKRRALRGPVETKTVDTELRHYSIVATRVVPQTNFKAGRAVLPEKLPATTVVENRRAEIRDRTIRAGTPSGAEELRQQLLAPH
jgi:hypothetical protein